jgi:hypothetical protein
MPILSEELGVRDVETMNEIDELRAARGRIRELEHGRR